MAVTFLTRPSSRPEPPADPPTDDVALVARAVADRLAFEPLYARYFDPIYRFCHRRLGTHDAAEDAAALVFAKAIEALPGYRVGEGSFRSWLFTIAYRVVADQFRGRHPVESLAAAREVAADAPSPEGQVLAADERRMLRSLLAELPDDQRHVLELRLAGLSGAEIATVLGQSHAAVKMLQQRAVKRLRERQQAQAHRTEGLDGSR